MSKIEFDPNHSAHVVRLQDVREHPNADRLQLATVFGTTTIVVGLGAKDGDHGLYFQSELQLDKEFATINDLIRRKNPETGKNEGGMFDENCRVRTQTFRKEKSDGFFIELTSLMKLGIEPVIVNNLKEGEYFESLDGKPICKKYVAKKSGGGGFGTPGGKNGKSAKKKSYPMFKEHFQTTQSRFVMEQFEAQMNVILTEKLHGTSQRSTCTLYKEQYSGIRRLFARLFRFPVFKSSWVDIDGTRRVILDSLGQNLNGTDGFHNPSMRELAAVPFKGKLHKGETVFYEVVGYETSERPIMGRSENSKVSKEFKKKYGKETVFSYGCDIGESKVYVYRMTLTSVDGYTVDLPWGEVKERCKEIGVETVPEFYSGPMSNLMRAGDIGLGEGDQSQTDSLNFIFDEYANGQSSLDPKHIKEGICIRLDDTAQPRIFKHKSFEFKVLEGIVNPDSASENVEEEL